MTVICIFFSLKLNNGLNIWKQEIFSCVNISRLYQFIHPLQVSGLQFWIDLNTLAYKLYTVTFKFFGSFMKQKYTVNQY